MLIKLLTYVWCYMFIEMMYEPLSLFQTVYCCQISSRHLTISLWIATVISGTHTHITKSLGILECKWSVEGESVTAFTYLVEAISPTINWRVGNFQLSSGNRSCFGSCGWCCSCWCWFRSCEDYISWLILCRIPTVTKFYKQTSRYSISNPIFTLFVSGLKLLLPAPFVIFYPN